MRVTATNVRCHEFARLDCASSVTILSGPNGSGKTSLLEAVNVCSMARSFVPVAENTMIRQGALVSQMRVDAVTDLDTPYRATVELQEGVRKRISTTYADNLSARELIGALPTVALSPDHKSITFGAPADRRAFIDGLMAQSSRAATDLLFDHRRLLKQRNAGLSAEPPTSPSIMDVWTQAFIDASVQLVERRSGFIAQLAPLVREEYALVSGGAEDVQVVYQPDHVELGEEFVASAVADQLRRTADRLSVAERARGTSLFGPQKDEIQFQINGRSVRESASQGQHKSLLVALKLAEARLVFERRGERPVVLLDDVFSELDEQRARRVLDRILELGLQCLVTTTDGDRVLEHVRQRAPGGAVCVRVPADVMQERVAA
jgi:DNA replication and repair protein RecF